MKMPWVYSMGYRFFRAAADSFFSYRVVGVEKLVTDRGVIIAANHESFLDPPFIGVAYNEPIYYLARKTLYKGPNKWLLPLWRSIPVDQEKPDMNSLKKVINLVKGGEQVLLFPEGARTLDGDIQQAQPGVGLMVVKSKAMVQPIRIFGAREALPRGEGKIQFKPVTIVVGDPFELTPEELKAAKSKEGYQKVADRVMAAVAELKLPEEA